MTDDVEKLIERLEHERHEIIAGNADDDTLDVMMEAAAMLRNLAGEKAKVEEELKDERERRRLWENSAIFTGKEIVKAEAEIASLRAKLERAEADATTLWNAADDLIKDVKRRYPGEPLRCPYMIALDAAVTGKDNPDA